VANVTGSRRAVRTATAKEVATIAIKVGLAAVCLLPAAHLRADDSWLGIGPSTGGVVSLAVDPQDPRTLYAGTDILGVHKSTNGGRNWTAANGGLPPELGGLSVCALAIDPTSPRTLYAGVWSYDERFGSVFKSIDGGVSWNAVNSGLRDPRVCALAIDPANPQTVYAGTRAGGVFKSLDGGASWNAVTTGPWAHAQVLSLVIDPANTRTVYVGNTIGAYKSNDGGVTWNAINVGLPADTGVPRLAVDPSSTQTLFACTYHGLFRTTNGGTRWTHLTGFPDTNGCGSIAIDPARSETIYAVCYDETLKSSDGGTTWHTVWARLGGRSMRTLVIDPVDTQTVYAGCVRGYTLDAGVLKTTDGGTSWSAAGRGLSDMVVQALAVDPTSTRTVYAGGEGAYKTTDRGATWDALTDRGVGVLVVDPTNPLILYVGGAGVSKSVDGGSSWAPVNSVWGDDRILALAIDPMRPEVLYAGIFGGGVFKSVDGGTSWLPMMTGLPANAYCPALAIDPTNTETVYVSAHDRFYTGGVFKTTDGGASWHAMSNGLTDGNVQALAIDPTAPLTVYAGAYGGSVFKTTDGGESWSAVNTALTGTSPVLALAIDPSDTRTLYAGTCGGGVLRSADGGASWSAINAGLTNTEVMALAIDPANPQFVYAGTNGGSVFVLGAQGAPIALWLPVASHIDGLNGSTWRTDLGLLNAGDADATVTLRLHPPDSGVGAGANGSAASDPLSVAAGAQVILADVAGMLGGSGNGALEILSDRPIRATSRTYNALAPVATCFPDGTFGQDYGASTTGAGLEAGDDAWLPQLVETAAFRTNISVTNTGPETAALTVTLFDGAGAPLASFPLAVAPGEFHQETRPFAARAGQANLTRGYATITVSSGSGILASASVIDNLANDPTTIRAVKTSNGAQLDSWVQVGSRGTGLNGSTWRTDLGLLNPNPTQVQAIVKFNSDGLVVASSALIPAGSQSILTDVVGQLGTSGNGSLQVVADRPVVVSSRTYAVTSAAASCAPSATFGQGYEGLTAAQGLGAGESAFLSQLRETGAFRSNIAFTNAGPVAATLEVELYDDVGWRLTSFAVALAAGEYKQETRPFANRAGRTDLEAAYARVTVTSGTGVLVSASVIDNVTNDPTTIPMLR
jgi:photosystem II stability/assembly factor-like uncharacterized protein